MGNRNGKWKMLNENESGNKVRFTLGQTRGSVCVVMCMHITYM